MTKLIEEIWAALVEALRNIVLFLPKLTGAIIILLIGWGVGRFLGRVVRGLLERTELDDKIIRGTVVERMLRSAGTTFERLMGRLVSIFVYLVFILAAVDILGVAALSDFVTTVVMYIPSFIAGVIVLLGGLIATDYVVDAAKKMTDEYEVAGAPLVLGALRGVMYFVVLVVALEMWKIDTSIVYALITPLFWGAALGIGIALGLGLKDTIAEWAKKSFVAKPEKGK